ncbi:MaoC family dehydratase [Ramlibacter pallidus]|uniref:MaoC family dehydratase n=1 Tax=Ramlibacter pallidus TaxID=2780087 RepID=A0ABR9S237_9BURK|nr:MaoC family dehydratase [Ramlibacter pallidus]MBE7367112.1 MaoC family dehydratase [Ramlibacter pallidus]
MPVTIFWEDLAPGSVRELGSTMVDAAEVKEFAGKYDPQPFHLDEEAGKASLFGGLCASGWHTCAMAMRLTVDNLLRHSASLGSPGLESLKWLKPVFPGDRLTLRHTILESRAMRKRPDAGIVRSRWDLYNQDGAKVLEMEGYGMFRRRTPATPEEIARLDTQRPAG